MVDDASVLVGVSPFGAEFFVIYSLMSVVTISWEKLKPLLTLGGVFYSSVKHSISAPLLKLRVMASPQKVVIIS
jgi:hypothetical protein